MGAVRRWLRWRYERAPFVIATDVALTLILIGFMLFVLVPRYS